MGRQSLLSRRQATAVTMKVLLILAIAASQINFNMVTWVVPAWKVLDQAWVDPATVWEVTGTGWGPDMDMNGCKWVGMVEENAAPQRRSGTTGTKIRMGSMTWSWTEI